MPFHRFLAALTMLAALASPATAQGTWLHQDPAHGFQIRIPRFLKVQPREPHEEQILAKFVGKADSRERDFRGEQELTLLVVQIRRAAGPTTGSDDEQKAAAEAAKSIKDQSKEQLNSGTTVEEFLKHRGYKHDLVPAKLPRPPKCRVGKSWEIKQFTSSNGEHALIRSFLAPDAASYFGVVALGPGVSAFEADVARSVASLSRIELAATSGPDPYEGSTLRDVDGRRRVRSRLVKGWSAYDTENFLLITNSRNKKLIDDVLVDLELMRKEYEKHLPPLVPVDAVSTVRICASYDDYLDYGAPDGTGGYWSHIDEELVLFEAGKRIPDARPWLKEVDPIAVMYHEAMHQYLHYSNGRVPPTSWFNEGYGEYFGGATVDRRKGEITRIEKNKYRMKWIKLMQKQKAWPDLRSVVKMSQGEFYGNSALQNYAIGWAFCYFLEMEREKTKGRNEDWAAIPKKYIDALRAAAQKRLDKMPADSPKDWIMAFAEEIQDEAFEVAFSNIDFSALERAWIDAMKRY